MRSAILVAFSLFLATVAGAAEPTFPPGSRIGLTPPKDMVLSKRFSGFENPAKVASITFTEMPPEAYAEFSKGMTDEALKRQGITVSARETLSLAGKQAFLIAGEQAAGPMKIRKWLLAVADPSMTALVTAQSSLDGYSDAEMKQALTAMALRAPLPLEEQIGALPFRLGERGGFRAVRVVNGSAVLMTDGPLDVIKQVEQPVVIVASSFAPPPPAPEAREQLARSALASTQAVKDWAVERSQSFRQNGQDWHEIVARGTDTGSGKPIVIMQTIRFAPTRYIRMVGIATAEQRDTALPRFRKVIDSVLMD
jgi:hypothetical protein